MASSRLGGMEATDGDQRCCGRCEHLSDSELLERYAARCQEAAFAELVHRYGPLVLGVCRRILQDEHEAEDAFQATFIVLARRADSLHLLGSLGNWLYGVACRIAIKARANAVKRRANERKYGDMPASRPESNEIWSDLGPVIDEELRALPHKYRAALVLCFLEGKTHQEAAKALGWPSGSMSRRIQRARGLLRDRLSKRGIVLSASLLFTLLAREASASTVPARLKLAAVRAAIALGSTQAVASSASSQAARSLAEEFLKVPSAPKRLASALALLLLLGIGTGVNAFIVKRGAPPANSPGCCCPPAAILTDEGDPEPTGPGKAPLPAIGGGAGQPGTSRDQPIKNDATRDAAGGSLRPIKLKTKSTCKKSCGS